MRDADEWWLAVLLGWDVLCGPGSVCSVGGRPVVVGGWVSRRCEKLKFCVRIDVGGVCSEHSAVSRKKIVSKIKQRNINVI